MTLLDSNVAVCASERGAAHHDRARRMIVEAVSTEGAAINVVCPAEICVGENDPATVADRIRGWGVEVIDHRSLESPGGCPHGSKPRSNGR